MPIITVNLFSGVPCEKTISRIAERLTESTVRVLGKKRELVVLRFLQDKDTSRCFIAGKGLHDKGGPLYEVGVKVTKSTNTKEQISTWVREAHETMLQALGSSEGPNYIHVDEMPSENWGYDGITQLGRQRWAS